MLVEILTLVVCIVLAAALMAAAHYASPRVVGRDLHRLEAYAVGCALGIVLPFVAWVVLWSLASGRTMPVGLAPVGLMCIIAGAGLGTGLGWWLDARAGRRAKAQMERGSLEARFREMEARARELEALLDEAEEMLAGAGLRMKARRGGGADHGES